MTLRFGVSMMTLAGSSSRENDHRDPIARTASEDGWVKQCCRMARIDCPCGTMPPSVTGSFGGSGVQKSGTAAAGSPKNCTASEASNNCTDTTTDVPSDQNRANTKEIKLPAECAGRIHRIVVHEVGSKEPVAYVECAAKENPISDTRPVANPGR